MPTGIGTAALLSSIIGAGGSAIGGALGNKSTQQQTTTPTTDPQYQPLQAQILKMVQDRLSSGSLPAGYESGGIKGINATFDATKGTRDNMLAARGLATSPVAGAADVRGDLARTGAVGDFRASLPLVQRDLQTQDLGMAGNLLSLGRGTTSTGTATGSGGAGGAATNLAGYLGYLQGKNLFSKNTITGSSISSANVSPGAG